MIDIERFLKEYTYTKRRIHELELDLKEIEAKRNAQYDKLLRVKEIQHDKITGGPNYDPVVEAVSKLVDVYGKRQKRVADDLEAVMSKLSFIEDTVNKAGLSEEELRYVRLRYFMGLKVKEVAKQMVYSERQLCIYKCNAIAKISLKISASK